MSELVQEKKKRWKGKFVKEKNHNKLLTLVQNGKTYGRKRNRDANEQFPDEPAAKVDGNRIINLAFMSKKMYCSSCKKPLLIQNIEDEKKMGLASIFHVKCQDCKSLSLVKSGEQYCSPVTGKEVFSINTKAALGAIHSGQGNTHLQKLHSVMDIPTMNSSTFKSHERIIGPMIEYIAKESCLEAAEKERVLTLETIEELKKFL